jgi:hypothetical protein
VGLPSLPQTFIDIAVGIGPLSLNLLIRMPNPFKRVHSRQRPLPVSLAPVPQPFVTFAVRVRLLSVALL